MQLKHKQTKCEHSMTKIIRITAFSVGSTMPIQRIILKDDIEFPCLLGHLVHSE